MALTVEVTLDQELLTDIIITYLSLNGYLANKSDVKFNKITGYSDPREQTTVPDRYEVKVKAGVKK